MNAASSRNRPPAVRSRGRPLVMLVMVLGGWSLLRAATWEGPDSLQNMILPMTVAQAPAAAPPEPQGAGLPHTARPPRQAGEALAPPPASFGQDSAANREPLLRLPQPTPPAPMPPVRPPAPQPTSRRMATGQAMLMAAGFGAMQLPPELAAWFNARSPGAPAPVAPPRQANALVAPRLAAGPAQAPAAAVRRPSRWSADSWLLWRDDATTPINSGRPTYGRSQAGAVARYRIAPASGYAPQAYLRVATALQGTREREVALGLSARPLAEVPVRVAGELRASERPAGTELRPAAYAVTELAPQALPLGASAEAYAQAGYVGGRARTAFVDGQLRVDRSVARTDDFDLRAGGGAWGGAQRGSARLDIGPSAAVTFDIGEARGRLAADYRIRVAGDARPASGPALTLSAGF